MKAAILQSNYIPWKGYFDIINDVDIFVILDNVQYTKMDWRNRNLIKTRHGLQWLTVPVQGGIDQQICDVKIDYRQNWVRKHTETLRQNYSKSSCQKDFMPLLEASLNKRFSHLSMLNVELIKTISKYLEIDTKFVLSTELTVNGYKTDRLVNICNEIGADHYISGPSAKNYIIPEKFESSGIQVQYKDYSSYPVYPQLFDTFEHKLSILDLIFNTGKNAPHYIWKSQIKEPGYNLEEQAGKIE